MITEVVHILQRISCIWLAVSVIYPIVNNRIMVAAQRNNPLDWDRSLKLEMQPASLLYPAGAALVLTVTDILLSILE